MSIYRVEKKTKLPVIIGITIVVIIAIVIALILGGRKELNLREKKQQAKQEIKEIANGVEIFAISHYTKDIVADGKVKLPREFAAAKNNIKQLGKQFIKTAKNIEGNQKIISEIKTDFEEIIKAAESIKSPEEVGKIAERLMQNLESLASKM